MPTSKKYAIIVHPELNIVEYAGNQFPSIVQFNGGDMAEIHNPHDVFFKNTMSDKENAISFLQNYLPDELLRLINLDSLQIEKDSFVSDKLQESFFRFALSGSNCRNSGLYLFTVRTQELPGKNDRLAIARIYGGLLASQGPTETPFAGDHSVGGLSRREKLASRLTSSRFVRGYRSVPAKIPS